MEDSRSGKSSRSSEILINAAAGETRVAILEQGNFTELYIERESDRSVAGMVALGRVTRVLPGMQAAFVDIGLEKAAFLYVGDYRDEDGEDDYGEDDQAKGRRGGRGRGHNGRGGRNGRNSGAVPPKIDTLLKEGQEIVVQVAKDPIGSKGARITSHVSIAGRHLVLTPWAPRVGVSRRISSERERRRLRDSVNRIRPKDLGFIIRTAGEGTRDEDLEADIRYLTAVWDDIQIRKEQVKAPATLYTELSLPIRVIRDFANLKTKRIVVDDEATHEEMKNFCLRFLPDPKPKLEHYRNTLPIFDYFKVEAQIDANLGKKAWLKSGGYLIIDQSEALTAIDVNTGRYVGKQNLEETVLKTNLEAVKEAAAQLRFRNIGGLIIIDLIDMETAENREKVYRALQDALRSDKAKTNILKISELGLVEMTRKRTRENLVQQLCEPCSYCEGRGYVLSAESVAYKLLREIRKDLPSFCGRQIAVSVSAQVAEVLLGRARKAVASLGKELGRAIEIHTKTGLHQEQFEVTALDDGPPLKLEISWLAERTASQAERIAETEAEAPDAAVGKTGDEEPAVGDGQKLEASPSEAQAAPQPGAEASEPEQAQEPSTLSDFPGGREPEAGIPAADENPDGEAHSQQPMANEASDGQPAPRAKAAAVLDVGEENPILPRSEKPEES